VAKNRTGLANTDWLHVLFTTGRTQDVQLTASGGTDKVQYLLSGGLNQQDGIVVYANDRYQRLDFRTNINAGVSDRLNIGTNLLLSYAMQDQLSLRGDGRGIT